ncbi:MAG: FG-GAP repeat domain-containing protein [Planctomycetota bacterium]
MADFNCDGKLDIVTCNQSSFGNPSGNRFHVWKQQTADKWSGLEVECPRGEGIKLSDIDREGDLDVVIGAIRYENTGDILKGPWIEHVYSTLWKYADAEVQCHDLNNDDKPDVVIAEMHQGAYPDEVRVYLNQGGGLTRTMEVLSTTGSHDIILADIGADGDVDILGANHAGSFQVVQLWENLTRTIEKGDR